MKSGIVLINKKAGYSSSSVVLLVKRVLGAKKCGHLGTLDLEGEGLLPVTVNNACQLFDMFLSKDKTYETVFEFGWETDTLDISGKETHRKDCNISRETVERACKGMIGKSLQMPPQYSAKKVAGKVAYKEARKGNVVQLHPKEIEIFDIKVLDELAKNTFKFEITCSSGTYIRCVCRDLAKTLSTYGVMHCITRTRCGGFRLEDAVTVEEFKEGKFKLIACEDLFDFKSVTLSNLQSEKILNGQLLPVGDEDGQVKVFDENGFLGIGRIAGGKLKLEMRLM